MKPEELRNSTVSELMEKLAKLKNDLFTARMKSNVNPDSSKTINLLRKDIARVKTILREKEIEKEKVSQMANKA